MKLLSVLNFYKPAYRYGGPVHSVSSLVEAMAAHGAQVRMLTTDVDGDQRLKVPLGQPVMLDGVEVYYYPIGKPTLGSFYYSPALVRAFREHIRWADFAYLEVFYTHASDPMRALSRRHGVAYTTSLRAQLLPYTLNKGRLKKQAYLRLFGWRFLNQAAGLHCTDQEEARVVSALKLRSPLYVVPNGINLSRFADLPPRGALRSRLGITEDAPVLLYMGRLHSLKRPDIAVQSLITACAAGLDGHLIMAGHDEHHLAESLRATAHEAGCADRLHILGVLEGRALLEAVADSDLLVAPSEAQENFGMAAAEALAAGLPILTTPNIPVGNWAAEVGAGRTAPVDPAAFAAAAREMLSAREALPAMGQRGAALIRARFDIRETSARMLAHFESMRHTGRPLEG